MGVPRGVSRTGRLRVAGVGASGPVERSPRETGCKLAEKWRSLAYRKLKRGVLATNNGAERAINRSKIRYKSESGMMNGMALTQWAWSGRYGLDAGELVAA